jgi:hypothetical protein
MLTATGSFIAGCARYAPVPPVIPKRLMLDITLKTAAAFSSDFYYYIVLDTSGSAASDGPHEELSGENRAKNWSYYIVYHSGFMESAINTVQDIDLNPSPFNLSSSHYYDASAASDTIRVSLYLDTLITTDRTLRFNFITSRDPINSPDRNDIVPVDYLSPPYFSLASNRYPWHATSAGYPQISLHTPPGANEKPADIISWTVDIYQK